MPKRIPVLIAEDEDADVFFFQRAIQKAGAPVTLIVAKDGQEAVDYLEKAAPFGADAAGHPVPALLLLDLKMPRLNGFDVLAWIKNRPALKNMRVIVLTSSSDPADMKRARDLGAADYRVKTGNPERLLQLVLELQTGWIQKVAAK